ncbi:MAG: hypothetical protein JJU07_14120 [Natronohydrobacter sp.]|nr:hypothetical protein [Natronohydrobacter sp.]
MTKSDLKLCILGTVLAVICSLVLWRLAFFSTDLACLALLPLAVMVAIGAYRNAIDRRRALLSVTLKSTSLLRPFTRGRLFSAFTATSVAVFCITTLGYKSLFAGLEELLAAIAITIISAATYGLGLRWFARDVAETSLSWFSAKFAFFVTCIVSILPYIWIEIAFVTRLGGIDADFNEAISESLARLPARDSLLDEFVSIIIFLDAVRLWVVAKLDNAAIWIVYGMYAALVCAVIATTAISVATLYYSHVAFPRKSNSDPDGEAE